jgi:hypothetical protein
MPGSGAASPTGGEERVIVTIWSSGSAEPASLRIPEMLNVGMEGETQERSVLAVAFYLRFPRAAAPTILRIYEGKTLPGQLDAYVAVSRRGSDIDAASPDGPHAICMALDPPDRFIAASLWTDWAAIEASTGGDIQKALTTRTHDLLAGGGPSHYEIVSSL